MALETDVPEWFVGEDKAFRWTVLDPKGRVVPVTNWLCEAHIYRRRQPTPVAALPATVVNGPLGLLEALAGSDVSTLLGPGSYRLVLARTDPGSAQVLAQDDIILKARGV
jgi:hypothetical protein